MESVGAAVGIAVAVLVPLIIIGGVVLAMRRGEGGRGFSLDLQAVYLYVVAFVSLLIVLFTVFSLVDSVLSLGFQTYLPSEAERPRPLPPGEQEVARPDVVAQQARFVRQQIAQALASLLVTLPVWWFHWRGAARRARMRGQFLPYRLYLYAVMVIALVTAVVSGGQALARLFEWLLGAVNWEESRAVQNFSKEALAGAINGLVALALWTYHRRALGAVPEENGAAET